jgi:hypothetical protein
MVDLLCDRASQGGESQTLVALGVFENTVTATGFFADEPWPQQSTRLEAKTISDAAIN